MLINPYKEEVINKINNSPEGTVRVIRNDKDGKTYVWSSYDATHEQVQKALGLNKKNTISNEWEIHNNNIVNSSWPTGPKPEDWLLSDTQKVGAPLSALEKAPAFYSNVENAVKASKQNVADKNQWLSYLKNQPGVKPEELEWTIGNLPEGKITKQQLEQHIAENKVQLGEVWKAQFKKN